MAFLTSPKQDFQQFGRLRDQKRDLPGLLLLTLARAGLGLANERPLKEIDIPIHLDGGSGGRSGRERDRPDGETVVIRHPV